MKRLALVLLAVLTFGLCALAQTTTSGDIAGTITDPTGAVVANAPVTITNDGTGQTIKVTSNASGFYRAANLQPGTYTVSTSLSGFAPAKKRVDVAVGTATTLNLSLTTASTQTTVEVTAEAPVIETENGNITSGHDTREIELVPNGGGDQTYIAQTSPGVNINTASGGGYGNFSAFGLPGTSNLFTVNGNDNMDPYLNLNNSGATNLTLGANELSEVSVVTNGYSVQYGRQAGAQVNSVTKSGSNTLHGNAVYYWNGRAMNANNWFNKHQADPANRTDRGFVNANQWSASIGGPIKKDKTFFFVDTEGMRVIIPVPAQVFIPSPAFANYVLTTGLPTSSIGNQSAQIPYYQKLFSLFANSPGAQNANAATTLAASSNGGCGDFAGTAGFGASNPCALGYHTDSRNFAHEWTLAGRIDHQLTNVDKLYVRYHMDRGVQPTFTSPLNPIFNTESFQPSYDGQFNETHTFGGSAVNQFILSGAYYRAIFVNQNQAASLAAYPATTVFADGIFGDPTTGFGLGGENYVFPQGRNVTQYQVVDDFSITRGNHTLKLGTNFRRNLVSDFTTGVLTVPYQEVDSLTDFTQGITDLAEQRFPKRLENPVALWSAGWYGEDDWRVTPRLNLTLGLRVDHDSNPVCETNCFNRFAAGPFEAVTTSTTTPYNQIISAGLHQAFPQTDTLIWQPRVGFAWQPFGTGTVIRGGAGMFSDLLAATLVDNFIRNAPGDVTILDVSGTSAFAPGVAGSTYTLMQQSGAAFYQAYNSGGTSTTIAAAVPGFSGISYQSSVNHLHTPTFQEWNFQVEQAIGTKTSVSANYVGNHGTHIPLYDPWENVACRSTTTCGNLAPAITTTRHNTQFSTVRELTTEGYSHYNGLVLALQRKFSRGLQGSFSYTWSHATDTVSNGGILPWSSNDSLQTQLSPFSQAINYGNADYDVRHSMNANYVYELPFKTGNGLFNTLIGGWTVSGTFFYHTGYPFSVTDSTAIHGLLRNGSNTVYLSPIVGNPDRFACTRGPAVTVPAGGSDNCLNFANFAPIGTPGAVDPVTGQAQVAIPFGYTNQARNQFYGPGYFNTDMSLRKAFKLSERFNLSVGANAYNILNHPNFGNPSGALRGGTFASYFTTVNPPTSALGSGLGGDAASRSVQLEGRLTF